MMQEAKPPVDSAARAKPHMIAMVLVLHFTNEFASAAKAKGAFLVAPSTDIRTWQQALQTLFDRNAEAHQICSAFFEPKATAKAARPKGSAEFPRRARVFAPLCGPVCGPWRGHLKIFRYRRCAGSKVVRVVGSCAFALVNTPSAWPRSYTLLAFAGV